MKGAGLAGRRVLVVEDEYFIADEVRRALEEANAEVLGPVGRIEDALTLIGETELIDGAVLDVNLHDSMVFPVADILRERSVPIVFATGYERSALPARFADVPRCEKPVGLKEIAAALFGAG